jgi:hypothetical protein
MQDKEEHLFFSTFMRPFGGVVILFLTLQLAPFSFLPTLVGTKSVYHPEKDLLWTNLLEESWEKYLRENQ